MRALVASHKQLGDILLLQPAIRLLAAKTGKPVTLLTRSGMKPLVDLMPGALFRRAPSFSWYSHVYCLDDLKKSAIRSLLAPTFRRTLVLRCPSEKTKYHSFGFNKTLVPGLGDQYVAKYYWETIGGEALDFVPPQLERPPTRWAPDDFFEREWVLLNPTAGWKSKSWSVEKWRIILQQLLEKSPLPVVITSGMQKWQIKACEEICQGFPENRVLRTGGKTTLENFLWLVSNASMVLTVDGLASHLATAYGIPSVTLFGPTSVDNWHFKTPINLAVRAPDLGEKERFTIHLDPSHVLEALEKLSSK